MSENTTITLPKAMPLDERISEVSRQILEWIQSLENPFNTETDLVQLTKHENKDDKYSYHYIINRDVKSRKPSSPYKSVENFFKPKDQLSA